MRNAVDILGVSVDKVTMDEAVKIVKAFLNEDRVHTIYTPNAEIMMAAHREPTLKNVLNQADLLVADGAGVVLGSKILGSNLPERVAGFDLMNHVFHSQFGRKIKFFFFGGKPGVAEAAGQKVMQECKDVEIVGYRNGYFNEQDTQEIIHQINESGADFLLVALGAPRQEKWIHEHKKNLKVKICVGVGGTFDVLAGVAKRAPVFFQKHNLEWLYRLYKEPRRFIRMMDLPRFILLVTAKKLRLKS